MIPAPNVSNDSLQDVLSVAEAILHDSLAPARFAAPCLERAWELEVGHDDPLPAALAKHPRLRVRERERFSAAWREHSNGTPLDRDGMIAQVLALRRLTLRKRRRTLYLAWGAAALVLVGVLMLRMMAGSVVTRSDASVGPWRVEVFAIKEFRGPSAVFRAPDAAFDWKGPAHETMPKDKFATRLSTCIDLDQETTVEFGLIADDGARLFVDQEEVIDAWGNKNKLHHETIELEAGAHAIVVEHHDKKGAAKIHLTASIDGAQPGPLPPTMLRYSDNPEEC